MVEEPPKYKQTSKNFIHDTKSWLLSSCYTWRQAILGYIIFVEDITNGICGEYSHSGFRLQVIIHSGNFMISIQTSKEWQYLQL